jgi:hypothetical protein
MSGEFPRKSLAMLSQLTAVRQGMEPPPQKKILLAAGGKLARKLFLRRHRAPEMVPPNFSNPPPAR